VLKREISQPQPLLDTLASFFPDSSRTTLRQMLQVQRVRVNGDIERDAKRMVKKGDIVEVSSRVEPDLLPASVTLVYEDDDLIVINKASGLLTVPNEGEKDATLQNYLNEYLRAKGIRDRIHVVHRLDRDTSGVLVFAKSYEIRERLKMLFADHDIDRVYYAIVEGVFERDSGTFRSYLEEDEDTYQVRSTPSPIKGKMAVTHYKVLERGKRFSMIEVTLETGRKNQIRVHFSEAGHPVVGDERYGAKTDPIKRLGLHAHLLGFVHPTKKKKMQFTSPIPDAFRNLKL
jgi:tRNA pseudouridine32 synthase/23S rRNA pseudouridine746 synthase/23S rRNA pseudouridine1911/1915/1917 synthase